MQRMYLLSNPPVSAKNTSPLRFGILGAARIAPNALIIPAKSHPGVVITAVASRDQDKVVQYAKAHAIPKTYWGLSCYQKLIDDPEVDAIYIPLPNGLHFEWAMRSLHAGKHVLVEKPAADTPDEVRQMIALAEKKGLVLLEAIHWMFHPAAQRVKEIATSGELGNIKSIKAEFAVPSILSNFFFFKDDVRYNYALGGGCTMDMGVYPLSAIRYFTGTDPVDVTTASAIGLPSDATRIDRGMHATFAFPSSITGETYVDFGMPGWGPFGVLPCMIKASAIISLEGGEIEFFGFPVAHVYHSIKIKPTRGKSRTERVYKHPGGLGQEWWSTYRYQLEAFVDKVRGRTPQMWPEASDPVSQMVCVEKIYEKAGMPPRPASSVSFDWL